MVRSIIRLIIVFSFSTILAVAQEITLEDYKRAQSFLWENVNNKTVLNMRTKFVFFPDSSGFWFLNYTASGHQFEQVKFSTLSKEPLFDHLKVSIFLTDLLKKSVSADSLPFKNLNYINLDSIQFKIRNDNYLLTTADYKINRIEEVKKEQKNELQIKSPDGKWIAYSENYNLFIKSSRTGESFQLSKKGEENFEYGSYYDWADLIKGENGKRPARFWVNWSEDSKWLQANICDLRNAQKMYLLDYSVDSLYRPELYSYYRGSPGDTTLINYYPVFYNIEKKEEIKTSLTRRTHINDYYYYWIKDKNYILLADRTRGYQKLSFITIDLSTGKATTLFSETSHTNIGDKLEVRILSNQDKFIFTSERSGWNHIYSYHFKTREIMALTKGQYIVSRILGIDKKKGIIYFIGLGKNKNENPYLAHLYSVTIEGKNLKSLTPQDGNHKITLTPNSKYFVDAHSTVNIPTKYYLRSLDSGKIVTQLTATNAELLYAKGWKAPQVFETKARDGKTNIYGALWKPTNFNPALKYPIIDNSYTGPHTQVYPEEFEQGLWGDQALAELGFIVIKVDGMGTALRSKAFSDVSYKNMGQNLKDHVLAIKQLGQKYAWIDTGRVGIFGHSAGGFDAGHAVLEFPDFYKVAVATSADHDFRMEKAWWPEMYMGWPVDSSYDKVSNITMAPNLNGRLLIMHGGLDENVNPSATFKLAEALIKANKDFDMLILPSQHHGYKGQYRNYARKKTWNYFVKHLLGAEPIWDFE